MSSGLYLLQMLWWIPPAFLVSFKRNFSPAISKEVNLKNSQTWGKSLPQPMSRRTLGSAGFWAPGFPQPWGAILDVSGTSWIPSSQELWAYSSETWSLTTTCFLILDTCNPSYVISFNLLLLLRMAKNKWATAKQGYSLECFTQFNNLNWSECGLCFH